MPWLVSANPETILRAEIPAADAAAEYVIRQIAFIVEFLFDIVSEGGCVGRPNSRFARIVIRILLGLRVVHSGKAAVQAVHYLAFVAQQFGVEVRKIHAQVAALNILFAEAGIAR